MEKRWAGPEGESVGKRQPGQRSRGEVERHDGETLKERQALRERQTRDRDKETHFQRWSERQRERERRGERQRERRCQEGVVIGALSPQRPVVVGAMMLWASCVQPAPCCPPQPGEVKDPRSQDCPEAPNLLGFSGPVSSFGL